LAAASLVVVAVAMALPSSAAVSERGIETTRVPEDRRTIQAAIDAASPGDVIDIAAGIYEENLTVDVGVTLRGRAFSATDPRRNTTILDGAGSDVATILPNVTPAPSFVGLVIANGDNGIVTNSRARVTHSYFTGNAYDALEYDLGGGGVSLHNVMARNGDDAIDIDHAIRDVRIEDTRILRSGDDGVEIRLHDDAIVNTVEIKILDSQIVGSAQDGIQLIDYFDDTNRRIVVRGSLIRDVTLAAIGMMDNAETNEDFRAASIRERVHVFHNTFVDNARGISGGDNLIALNNIFTGHARALTRVDGSSIASFNLFWNNDVDVANSSFVRSTSVFADPRLTRGYRLRAGSPAVDAGTARFTWKGAVVMDQGRGRYEGKAPDIGWFELRR
jgi:hypothetical protein